MNTVTARVRHPVTERGGAAANRPRPQNVSSRREGEGQEVA